MQVIHGSGDGVKYTLCVKYSVGMYSFSTAEWGNNTHYCIVVKTMTWVSATLSAPSRCVSYLHCYSERMGLCQLVKFKMSYLSFSGFHFPTLSLTFSLLYQYAGHCQHSQQRSPFCITTVRKFNKHTHHHLTNQRFGLRN